MSKQFRPLDLGAMPCDIIARALDIQPQPGTVHFSIPAQEHAWERHGTQFMQCFPYVGAAVENPHFVGQHPRHTDGVELYHEAGGLFALVAVTLSRTNQDIYHIQSVYPVGQGAIQRRLRKKQVVDLRGG